MDGIARARLLAVATIMTIIAEDGHNAMSFMMIMMPIVAA